MLKVSGGLTVAQIVDLAAAPILTRLFTPESFGDYGVFMALVAILSVFGTFRLERALIVSDSPSESAGLVHSGWLLATATALLLALLLPVLAGSLERWATVARIFSAWGGLVGLTVGATALVLLMEFLFLKHELFSLLNGSRITKISLRAGLMILLGVVWGGAGLAMPISAAAAFAATAAAVVIVALAKRLVDLRSRPFRLRRIAAALRRNADYPRFLVPASFCNTATGQAPVLILGALLASGPAGQFFLAHRVMAKPMSIVMKGVSDVNFEEMARMSSDRLSTLYRRRVRRMAKTGAPVYLAAAVAGPLVFPIIFGGEWQTAGFVTSVLAPGLFIQFLFSPFSSLFIVIEAQRAYMIWAAIRLALIVVLVIAGSLLAGVLGGAGGFALGTAVAFWFQHTMLLRLVREGGR